MQQGDGQQATGAINIKCQIRNKAVEKAGMGTLKHKLPWKAAAIHDEGTKGTVAVAFTEQAEYWQLACSIGTQMSGLLLRASGNLTAVSAELELTGSLGCLAGSVGRLLGRSAGCCRWGLELGQNRQTGRQWSFQGPGSWLWWC